MSDETIQAYRPYDGPMGIFEGYGEYDQPPEEARKHWQDWDWDNENNAREGL